MRVRASVCARVCLSAAAWPGYAQLVLEKITALHTDAHLLTHTHERSHIKKKKTTLKFANL